MENIKTNERKGKPFIIRNSHDNSNIRQGAKVLKKTSTEEYHGRICNWRDKEHEICHYQSKQLSNNLQVGSTSENLDKKASKELSTIYKIIESLEIFTRKNFSLLVYLLP